MGDGMRGETMQPRERIVAEEGRVSVACYMRRGNGGE